MALRNWTLIGCMLGGLVALPSALTGQSTLPPELDPRLYEIAEAASSERVEDDIRTLAGFGTRNTLSDTLSDTRGIGAARRWIKAEFDEISEACGGCLEVSYHRTFMEADGRITEDVEIVNVVAILRGTEHPNRYVMMSGDIDSRASNGSDGETDAPGANDNASGMAGTIEAARILSQHEFPSSVAFVGLSGEEQGLWGGQYLAADAVEEGWDIAAVLNNDMIGNIAGIDGVIDNTVFRVFSQPTPVEEHEPEGWSYRVYGGEVDGPSRQIARYVDRIADGYFPNLDAMMIYRLDRFGRGGHHRPFNDAGFPGVRIMEAHEHYDRQHQDIRVEDGREYGDVIEGVDFDFAAKMTSLNATVLAAMAWAPPTPENVRIGGAVRPSTTLSWDPVSDPNLAGYKIYWRRTTDAQWQWSRWVGDVTEFTLENVVIDNYVFGVAAVGRDGNESPVGFPTGLIGR
ncbi:MAG: M28 family metallopeptidase [Gemmatimonadota bacterium]|nr:M28 family metallopeptidase [Gemmatimonadota bacterium]